MTRAYKNNHIDTLKLLLQHNGKISSELLLNACCNNDLATMSLLLKYNADVNCADEDGYPLIYFAVSQKNLDLTVYLLEHGAHGSSSNKTYIEARKIIDHNIKIVQFIWTQDIFCKTIPITDLVKIVCCYITLVT